MTFSCSQPPADAPHPGARKPRPEEDIERLEARQPDRRAANARDYYDRMANWTDGPEYAPLVRPTAFETPIAEPLEVPPPVPNLAAGAPVLQPQWQPPQVAVVPLRDLVPAVGPAPRDPHAAFATISATMTGASAWGSAHSATGVLPRDGWTPDQPLLTTAGLNTASASPTGTAVAQPPGAGPAPAPATGQWPAPGQPPAPAPAGPAAGGLNFPPPRPGAALFPQPGTPDWFAPAPQQQYAPPTQTVTVGQMWQAATPGVIIPLVVGALVNPLSLIMLGLSAVLAGRVRYRLAQVKRTYQWTFGVLGAIAVLTLFNSDLDLDNVWSVASSWAQLCCWIVPVVVLLQVGAGIRAKEPPTRP